MGFRTLKSMLELSQHKVAVGKSFFLHQLLRTSDARRHGSIRLFFPELAAELATSHPHGRSRCLRRCQFELSIESHWGPTCLSCNNRQCTAIVDNFMSFIDYGVLYTLRIPSHIHISHAPVMYRKPFLKVDEVPPLDTTTSEGPTEPAGAVHSIFVEVDDTTGQFKPFTVTVGDPGKLIP